MTLLDLALGLALAHAFAAWIVLGAYARRRYEMARLRAGDGDRLSERSFERLAAKVDADEARRVRRG